MPDDLICGDFLKKDSTAIGLGQEVWRTLITFKKTLTALSNTPFEKLQNPVQRVKACR